MAGTLVMPEAQTMTQFIGGLIALLIGGLIGVLYIASPRPRPPTPNEKLYRDLESKYKPLPSIHDPATVTLSVVVPAYNESSRLPPMLTETIDYLDARKKKNKSFTYEVLIVDDGSKDDTAAVVIDFAKKRKNKAIRVLTLEKNRGKGGSVTQGMLQTGGEMVMFADADGATKFEDLEALEAKLHEVEKNGLAVAVGSRSHLVSTDAVVKRSFIRNFLMHGFHMVLKILGISGIEDTQCGFKLFTRAATARIFPNMHVEGWIFDVEVLVIALKLGIPVAEVQVNWHEIEGSKVDLLQDSILMGLDLLIIRANYLLQFWNVKEAVKPKSE